MGVIVRWPQTFSHTDINWDFKSIFLWFIDLSLFKYRWQPGLPWLWITINKECDYVAQSRKQGLWMEGVTENEWVMNELLHLCDALNARNRQLVCVESAQVISVLFSFHFTWTSKKATIRHYLSTSSHQRPFYFVHQAFTELLLWNSCLPYRCVHSHNSYIDLL